MDDPGSNGWIAVVLAALASVAAATGALLFVRRRRNLPHDAGPPLAVPRLALAGPPARAKTLLFSTAGNGGQRGEGSGAPARRNRAPEGPNLRPPDPTRDWTAEVRWQHSGGESRFCVVVSDRRDGDGTVIARSEPLDWPPQDADAVQALVVAVDALTEALTASGWTPIPGGSAWYEKRFAYVAEPAPTEWVPPRPGGTAAHADPAPAPTPAGQPPARPAARPAARRFRPAAQWPPDSHELARCETRWRSGYIRSRFEVVMHDPVRGGERVIATSESFKWLLMGDPEPSNVAFRDAARRLASAVEAAGWERVGPGADWYAMRFVWRGDGPPADEIEANAAGTAKEGT